MFDIETVIKGCENWVNSHQGENYLLTYSSVVELLDILKKQEAIEPYMDYDGKDVWRCGKCGNSLMHPSYDESDKDEKNYIRYCSHCGHAVKWEV